MRIADLKGADRPDWLHPTLPMHKETFKEEQLALRRNRLPLTEPLHDMPWRKTK